MTTNVAPVAYLSTAVLLVTVAVMVGGYEPTAWRDPSTHQAQFVTVDGDVRLEVLDWGGSGRPVVLLAGSGNSAHVFDNFARHLTGCCHV
ncbi:MAG: hypothetical protein QF681_16865, partial [Vicinamibacterales bacterium]|nr:hypothetical protein [Vicinamibacterales bacterium]